MTNFNTEKFNELQDLIQEVNDITNGAYENVIKNTHEEFWDLLEIQSLTPSQVANMVHFGSYNPMDEYIGVDGYGNIETMDTITYYNELKDIESELLNELE